jgi:phosphoribosylformimino-5-aminoimidazole carboxamide ribotide isomerase
MRRGRLEVRRVRIIPVIDLRDGRAVRGASGNRATYRPVTSGLLDGTPRDLSDPVALLRAYRERLGSTTVYVADLDRIEGRGRNDATLQRLLEADPEVRFLLDAGLGDAGAIAREARNGRVIPVIGTETLRSIEDLRSLRRPATAGRVVLSLDLSEDGVVAHSPEVAGLREEVILHAARERGIRTALILLLHRVGTCTGLPRERLRRLQVAAPGLELIVGGGIRSLDDLVFLRDAGFLGALLATALHEGTVTPPDLALL